ncbi:glycoside hydrolase family 16 protein [Conidiobolus coronatus NRRL 28638]|uniref:Glycoside hydrolase family 16 protein n=1 Tax=Conidiobolus coronatus (strain ATCC 28846 / CBS 209.66 / NRRL 28638) TaxID=796925 RepID=A0A137NZL6_CONC2|nr:glycoside hydrolase family 16 protein [Conidiobolus coronatus NRRL 28638]|eukprot:KXN68182.1 glycoside hydrolase family 16 protein [Conidiobolus coronatus NRRL 28638]
MNLIYLLLPLFVSSQTCISRFEDFTDPNWTTLDNISIDNGDEYNFVSELSPNKVTNRNGHMLLRLSESKGRKSFRGGRIGLGAVFSTTETYDYGRISAVIKVGSTGPGVVTTFGFETLTGEVIEFSITGKDPDFVYTDYQTDSNLGSVNRKKRSIGVDLTEDWHEFTINWEPSSLQFLVDGDVIRTIDEGDARDDYPTTPSLVKFSIYDAGGIDSDNAVWAGFPTSYFDGQAYVLDIDSLEIDCYDQENP